MLKHMNVDEMVGLTAAWVDDARRSALFLSIPDIAALHPKIAQAHVDLVEAQLAGAVSPAMQKIIGQRDFVRHDAALDHFGRGARRAGAKARGAGGEGGHQTPW